MRNEAKYFGILKWVPIFKLLMEPLGLLEPPSTSMAANDIVIMSNFNTKEV